MSEPQRVSSLLPLQKHISDTVNADNDVGGMGSLLATPRVYSVSVKSLAGGGVRPRPYLLLSTFSEIRVEHAYGRVGNSNAQQVDVFTADAYTSETMLAIIDRMLYLFDGKRPAIAGFRVVRKIVVEVIGATVDADGVGGHAITVVRFDPLVA